MDGIDRLPKFASRSTRIEEGFLLRVVQKHDGTRIYRHGWPDFLLVDDAGKAYAVEVKARSSEALRKSQEEMFPMLEQLGVTVYVWAPDRPDRLVPWRKWRVQSRALRRKPPWFRTAAHMPKLKRLATQGDR